MACSDAGDGPSSTPEAPAAPSDSTTTPGGAVLVTDFGAAGDGAADDTAAVEAALRDAATHGSAVHFPPGTYAVGDLTIPDGAVLTGAGRGRAWLQGRVEVGSSSRLTGLTIGRDGAALRFVDGASGTVFRRVRFVGGGGMKSGEDQGVIRFHEDRAAWKIRFVDCRIGANSADGNGVSMVSRGRPGGTYRDISWVRCRFEGSPRMNFEIIQRPDGDHPVTRGYRRIDLIDCVFEPSGSESVSYDAQGPAGDCTISGCTFKGAGWNAAYPYGQGIEFNGPTRMRFIGNTVYRCRQAMINHKGRDGVVTATVIEGNVFDGTRSFIDVVPERPAQTIYFTGVSGARFAGNVVKTDVGGELAYLDESSRNTFAGNTWLDTRPPGEAFACVILTDGSSSNEFVRERFETAAGDHAVHVGDGSQRNVFRGCLFVLPSAEADAGASGVAVDPGLTVRVVGGAVRRE